MLLFATAVSCIIREDPEKIAAARVGDEILYLTEIKNIIPDNTSFDDSLLMAGDYIQKWVRTELLIKKAEENLTLQQRDVSKELQEYRNSLIIFRYQQELMRQKMDTTITRQDLSEFYRESKSSFILDHDLLKAIFIKIPVQVSKPEQVKAFCENPTPENLKELGEYCTQYAIGYETFINQWIDASLITQRIPEFPGDLKTFLERRKPWESKDKDYYYLLFVYDYRLKGGEAPIEFIEPNLRNLIMNKRKIDFLKKLEEDVYLEGVRNDKFKVYELEM